MKAILDSQAIKIAYAVAPPKVKRPILECVKIGNSKIVAADGFMLAIRTITTDPEEGEEILIKAKALLEAKAILKAETLLIESQDGKTATISSESKRENALNITITTDIVEGKFPMYQQVIPKSERKAYVALQANIVAKLLKTTSSDDGIAMKIKVREPADPVEIHIRDTDIYVMPYFVPEE